jgi:hypothetical protein
VLPCRSQLLSYYTYCILKDGSLRFSETGASILKDFTSSEGHSANRRDPARTSRCLRMQFL